MNTAQFFEFDTYDVITADCPQPVLDEAVELCARYDALLSKTVPGSDVWRVNRANGAPTEVSAHTMRILACAARVGSASEGAFDVTLGGATEVWKRAAAEKRPPAAETVAALAARLTGGAVRLDAEARSDAAAGTGHGKPSPGCGERDLGCVKPDPENLSTIGGTVTVAPGTQIDLGGIAKGYITDQIATFLRSRGVASALLNFGGNIVTVGPKPDGSPWKLGLQTPGGVYGQDYWAELESAGDETFVTSGTYERFFEYEGVRYHHILDPRTCAPVRNDIVTATVCGTDSMLCDAVATAVLVMGKQEGLALARSFGLYAAILDDRGRVSATRGLDLAIMRR